MSKKEIKLAIKNRKIEIIFFFLCVVFLFLAKVLFPNYKNFINYFTVIFILLFLFFLFILISKDIKEEKLKKAMLNQGSYHILAQKYKDNLTYKKLYDMDMLIKDYEDEAKTSNKDLKDYITRWTHQIKSPIFALDLLLNDEEIDVEASKSELFEIEEYVQNILAYIRMDSDTTDYAFSRVDLDKEVRSTIKKYARQIIYKNN